MCDPMTLIGLTLTAGSIGANAMAQNAAASSRAGYLAAERTRQRQYDQEAAVFNNQARNRYEGFDGQQQQKAGNLQDYYKRVTDQVTANAPTEAPIASNTGGVVAREAAKQKGKAQAFVDQQNTAFANQNAFGSLFGDLSRLQARDAGKVGQIGKFKKGSSNVLPLELNAAQSAGSDLKMLGDVLGGLGSIGVKAGLGGGGGSLSSMFGSSAGAASPSFVSPYFLY